MNSVDTVQEHFALLVIPETNSVALGSLVF